MIDDNNASKENRNISRRLLWVFLGMAIASSLFWGFLYFSVRERVIASIPVTLFFNNAVDKSPIFSVQIEWIQEFDNPEGESIYIAETDKDGKTEFNIPVGEYTIKWNMDGYYEGHQNVLVSGESIILKKYLLPCVEGNFAYILAEWNEETDMDLCVYNQQEGKCIGVDSFLRDNGSFLYNDNHGEYELVRLIDYSEGNYEVYVKDCGVILGEYNSSGQSGNVTVSIYTADSLLFKIESQAGEMTGFWNAFSLSDGIVEEQDKYIHDFSDYAWALRDKNNLISWIKNGQIKLKEEYGFWNDGSVAQIVRYEYNTEGNLIAKINYSQMRENQEYAAMMPFDVYRYNTYDENGCLEGEYFYKPVEAYICEYNENGNLAEELFYNLGGLYFSYRYEYQYDASGKVIVCDCYYNDDVGTLYTEERYQYDAYGNVVFYCLDEGGDGVWEREEKYDYEYGEDGSVKGYFYYCYYSDELTDVDKYEYDASGKLICTYSYDDADTLEYYTEYKYDRNGNLISRYTYDDKGSVKNFIEYKYDINGIMRVRENLDSRFEYNENGDLAAHYARYDNHLSEQYEYVYDANSGMVISYCDNDKDGIWDREKIILLNFP